MTVEVVWESQGDVLFTELETKAFGKTWRAWRPRNLQLRNDATLIWFKGVDLRGKADLSEVVITKVGLDMTKALTEREVGIHVMSRDAVFRCVLPENDLERFLTALKPVASSHNIESLRHDNFRAISTELSSSLAVTGGTSVMRRAVARAMEKFEKRSRRLQIRSRRGSLRWLPVSFANDLVHGSWWFVAGSVYVVLSSSIVLANRYDSFNYLGDDSSEMSDFHYRATWFLVLVSGLMFTLGSLAFVKAMHDPPLQPWFPSWYHFQNDELVGSWFFLLGVLPLVPYCLIFIVESSTLSQRCMYALALAMSTMLLVGSYLFVRACYPDNGGRGELGQGEIEKKECCELPSWFWIAVARFSLAPVLCLFGDADISRHLANDWLAGCWLVLWLTVLATLGCFALFLFAAAKADSLQMFIYGTGWSENLMFVVGSAYFVSGSYPKDVAGQEGLGLESPDADYVLITTTHGPVASSSSSAPPPPGIASVP